MKRLVLIFLALPLTANATLISQTFTLVVEDSNHEGIFLGDRFEFSVSFDNEGTRGHEYRDGSNGVGEFGEGDDLEFCFVSLVPASDCPVSSEFGYFDDATYDLTDLLAPIINEDRGHDARDDSRSWAYGDVDGRPRYDLHADDLTFFGVAPIDPRDQIFFLSTFFRSDVNNLIFEKTTTYGVLSIETTVTSVPEPSTLGLLGAGLLGLAFVRRRRAA